MIFMIGWQELAILSIIGLLLLVPILAALWVYRDAMSRNNPNAVIWTVGTVLAWFAVLIVYLIVRPDFRSERQTPPV